MKGYIGVTAREWFEFLSNNKDIKEVNFWRKNTNNFNVLSPGEPFYFLVKNEKGVKGERPVLGMANFERFEILTVKEAWDKYKQGNGDKSKDSYIHRMNKMFGTDINNGKIGCIILSGFKQFEIPVYLRDIGIDFKNSIVSGKKITESEVGILNEYGFRSLRSIISQFNEINKMDLTEDDAGFPEGRQVLKQHLVRERNSEVIRLAKERFLKRHGKLFCEVCGFDFKEHYGEIGEGYIEAHHTKPVSEMSGNETTKVEDLALVCANCHRMLHRKRPWLSISELKQLLSDK